MFVSYGDILIALVLILWHLSELSTEHVKTDCGALCQRLMIL